MGFISKMSRKKPIKIEIEVEFVPFPNEERRRESYELWAKTWLKAKERMLKKESEAK